MLKFERKPIQPNPVCAMCGKPVKDHTGEQMKFCMEERRKINESTRSKRKP